MKLPRDLSGDEVIKCLCRDWGYEVEHRRGSHVKLSTYIRGEGLLTVTIPAHPVLKVGTLNAILQVVAKQKNVLKEDLLNSLR